MIELTFWYVILIGTGALAAFVAARAWDYPPSRLFVLVCASLLSIRLFSDLRDLATSPAQAMPLGSISHAGIAALDLLLLLLFAALFAPAWFEGRVPARWIAAPYIAVLLLILVDGAFGLGFVFSEARETAEGFRLQRAQPGGTVVLALFFISWLPHLALLLMAFVKQRHARVSIGLLLAALLMAQITGSLDRSGILQSLPIIIALAYAVLRTRLLLPTRAGIDSAVEAMADAVVILDRAGGVTFANPAAAAAGLPRPEHLAAALAAADDGGQATIEGRSIAVRRASLTDRAGRPIGSMLLGRDVTELERRQELIERERAQLAATVERLTASQSERAALAETVRQLALPVIPALPGVLIMPLVGSFDGARIDEFSETLLRSIERERARLVLIDITGLPLLDTGGAGGLVGGVRAAALLGARCVLVGVRPEIAQALVGLGVSLGELETVATLQQALARELGAAAAPA